MVVIREMVSFGPDGLSRVIQDYGFVELTFSWGSFCLPLSKWLYCDGLMYII